jgi:putative flippase GtrA
MALIKFILVGAFNTFFGYILYVIFIAMSLGYMSSYIVSYILSILVSYVLNSKFVFKVKLSKQKMLKFPLVYLFQFVLGIILLHTFVDLLNIDKFIAPLIIIVISIPLTFILSKFILTKDENNS